VDECKPLPYSTSAAAICVSSVDTKEKLEIVLTGFFPFDLQVPPTAVYG